VTGWDIVLVAAAGAACGVINSIAGGGSLILFPVLLLTGLKPLDANVTNSVSTWPGYVGGVGGFRAEIRERRHRLPRLLLATIAGSVTGCVLLLATPSSAFDVIIPWLVLAATALTALQPAVRKRLHERSAADSQAGVSALVMIFLAAIYGGYFGGALGVIVLAVLGLTIHDTLRHLNATKSVISLVDASISVIVFGLFGPVHWAYVAVAAPTTLVGGYLGAAIARRLDERVLRACVIVFGLAASAYLFVQV
jgi:hypothetical protein